MVSSFKAAMIFMSFMVTAQVVFGAARRNDSNKCKRPCMNRYGRDMCCDGVARNDIPMCPPTPRILVNCDSPQVIVKKIQVNECENDSECPDDELCCSDVCNESVSNICMPSQFNTHYLMP